MSAERIAPESWRLLSIVFADVVGSTSLSVVLDGEDYISLIDRFHALSGPIIDRHQGFLGRDEGDGRFVWFGWPSSAEDDAERAVRMSLELCEAMKGLREEVLAEFGVEMAVRVGVHTGEIIVRDIPGRERPELIGAAANVAAKVQASAPSGTVAISEATAGLTRDVFDLEPVDELQIAGLAGHLDVFTVQRESTRRPSGAARLVNRSLERSKLGDLWRAVRRGGSRSVLLLGEAGIGKSSLVASFLDSFALGATRVTLIGDSYRQQEAFQPLWPALADVDLDLAEGFEERLSQADQRAGAMNELVDAVRRRGGDDRIVFVIEDAHWLDPSTSEVVQELVDAQLPGVMMLVLSRVDTSLEVADHVHTMLLGPLAPDDLATVVARAEEDLPREDIERIVSQCAGNPFFASEMARANRQRETFEGTRRALLPHSEVPIVVQQSLRAQLEQSPSAMKLASTAAVIGREFTVETLAGIYDTPDLARDLEWLRDQSIIEPTEGGFSFRHGLIHQLAYDLPVRDELQRSHSRAADHLVQVGEGSDELIGLHLDRAGRAAEAAARKIRAAVHARSAGAFTEGIALIDRSLELLETEPNELLEIEALELKSILAAVVDELGYTASQRDRARLNQLLENSDEGPQVRAVTRDWAGAMVMSDLRTGGGLLRRMQHLSRNDPVGWILTRSFRATHMMYRGNFTYAAPILRDTALELAEQNLKPEFRATWSTADDPVSVALSRVPPLLWVRGELEQAEAALAMADSEAATIAGPSAAMAAAHVKANSALFHELSGNGRAAMELGAEIVEVGSGPGLAFWEQIGHLHQLMGSTMLEPNPVQLDKLMEAAQAYDQVARLFSPVLYLQVARGQLAIGDTSKAAAAVDGAQAAATETGARWLWAESQRLRAATVDETNHQQELLRDSVEWAQRQGARVIELRSLADLLAVESDDVEALAAAERALETFPSPGGYPEFDRLSNMVA